jgi:hypothetical protein
MFYFLDLIILCLDVLCSRTSILQIAFHSVVFILDLDALCDRDELTQFIDSLFHNPKIIKIGILTRIEYIVTNAIKFRVSIWRRLIAIEKGVAKMLVIVRAGLLD